MSAKRWRPGTGVGRSSSTSCRAHGSTEKKSEPGCLAGALEGKGWHLIRVAVLAALLTTVLRSGHARAELDGPGKDQVAAATVLIVALVIETEDGVPIREHSKVPLGSAVLVSEDGYLLTNNHVIDTTFLQSDVETEAASLGIELELVQDFLIYVVDDRGDSPKLRYTATVQSAIDSLDLAVLQITGDEDGDPLRRPISDRFPVPLAPPGPVENGEAVYVFGYPVFGDESFGGDIGAKSIDVVDSRVRSLEKGPGLRNVVAIHLDAAVSGGSSGGAVVNEEGQLIGIVTQRLDGTGGGSEAMAIPIDRATGALADAGWVEPELTPPMETVEAPVAVTEAATLPTLTPTPFEPGNTLPASYIALWEGNGTQSNLAESWPVSIALVGGQIGSVIGTSNYPSLSCGGKLTLDVVSANTVEVTEDLTFGLDLCTDTGVFVFSIEPDRALRFDWHSADASYVSSGTLYVNGSNQGAEAVPESTFESVPVLLATLLPTIEEIPPGLVQTDDQTRTLELSSQVYSDPADMKRRFQNWGWRGNVFRSFGAADSGVVDPVSTSLIAVSIHEFGSAEAASQALDYALNDEVSVFGHQEIDLTQLGDRSRAISGREPTGNETIVYTQVQSTLIVVAAISPEGDPTFDAKSVAGIVLQKRNRLA